MYPEDDYWCDDCQMMVAGDSGAFGYISSPSGRTATHCPAGPPTCIECGSTQITHRDDEDFHLVSNDTKG